MNVKRELIQISGIVNIVCRDNGDLEIYYIDKEKLKKIQDEVMRFINAKCLNSCFTKINFIQVENQIEDRTEDFEQILTNMDITKSEAIGLINFLVHYKEINKKEIDFRK
jgi:hypothetical protein